MKKKALLEYFVFTRKERVAIIALCIIITAVAILPHLLVADKLPSTPIDPSLKKVLAESSEKNVDTVYGDNSGKKFVESFPKATLFPFDPNQLSEEGWRKLGISARTIKTIKNFLAKGGRFYMPADIGKVYGLKDEDVERLLPYVHIEKMEVRETTKKVVYGKKAPMVVAINDADSAALEALPGIGSKLARRIVNFRDKLGGFYSVSQVAETFGLPDSTFQKISPLLTCDSGLIKRININIADLNELKQHPYIRYELANAILQYRVQHGPYQAIDQLEKLMLMSAGVLAKLRPYLSVE